MSLLRILFASLVSYLAIAFTGGNAQISSEDAATTASSVFLYSVDILLDESKSPVVLGIRDGQTVAQVGLTGFCGEGRSCLVGSEIVKLLSLFSV